MLNSCAIQGRFTRDPELRYTQSQIPVVSFTLACERDFMENGEKKTDFIEVVAWNKAAENVSKYFKKGSGAVVIGRLQLRSWNDKDGNKRYTTEIIAERVYFAGDRKKDDTEATFSDLVEADGGKLPF